MDAFLLSRLVFLFFSSVVAWCIYSVSLQAELFCYGCGLRHLAVLFVSCQLPLNHTSNKRKCIWFFFFFSFLFCYGKCYLTYLKVAWRLMLAWRCHVFSVQCLILIHISLCGVDSSQSLHRDVAFPFLLYPRWQQQQWFFCVCVFGLFLWVGLMVWFLWLFFCWVFFLVLGVWHIGLWKLCAGVEASLYPGNGGVRLLGACTLDSPIPDSAAPAHVAWMVMILSFDLMSATVFSLNCGFISGLSGEWTEWKAL